VFSYVCWVAPKNVPVNQLFGVRSGMGMGVLTFDWSQISWIGSPLMGKFLVLYLYSGPCWLRVFLLFFFWIPFRSYLLVLNDDILVPWWAELHIFIGFVVFYWILTPILYYTNVSSTLFFSQSISSSLQSWDLAYFPISANGPFDRFGRSYNISRVLLR
jgi:hypothetical protein